jgi:glycosyltransferase involved in cell wall biosynthesis
MKRMNRDRLPKRAISNQAASAPPRLSVLVPVYRHDPSPLLQACASAAARLEGRVEFILHDDGSCDEALTARMTRAINDLACPASLTISHDNEGRSVTRNALLRAARARHALLVDADMIPDAPNFLDRWLTLAQKDDPAVAFGGFSVKQAPREKRTALHRYTAQRSECRDAVARARSAAQFTTTSNLLVRRDVWEQTPFDAGFAGWGWEDVDWALRVSRRHAILHVDIPATHAGLDTSDTLLRKYEEGGANYRRLAERHPDAVARFASHRAARLLQRIPGMRTAKPTLAAIARLSLAPLALRHAALKLYRTSVYAENLP